MKIRKTLPILGLASLLLVTACGNDSSKSGNRSSTDQTTNNNTPEEENEEPSDDQIHGTYLSRFTTLNSNVVGVVPGSLTFYRKPGEDRMMAFLRLFAGSPATVHPQNVHVGNRCPNMSDDTNGDGHLDINEVTAVVGKILIPLDSNLNSQAAGRNTWPVGDLSGSYHWERVVSFKRFLDDLSDTHSVYSDEYTKLAQGEKFDFAGKVVIIQGVAKDKELPETVATIERRTPQQTYPIACGIIQKVTQDPGTIETSETMSDDVRAPRRTRTSTSDNDAPRRDEAPQDPPP